MHTAKTRIFPIVRNVPRFNYSSFTVLLAHGQICWNFCKAILPLQKDDKAMD